VAPVIRAALLLVLAGCGDLVGFAGEVPALATIQLTTTGDFEAVRVPGPEAEDLRVALVWSTQWLPEPLCFLPPETPEVAAAIAAGCRNSLAFTPERVTATVPITAGVPAELALLALPSADLMFGDVTARVAYASLVVFDDRDHDGVLGLASPLILPSAGEGPDDDDDDDDQEMPSPDLIYGASFVAMTEPDTRLAFREGTFFETGFYPRHGCGEPLPGFSILAAGGFTFADALAATQAGVLPAQDPATCAEHALADTTVAIGFRAPAEVSEVRCKQRKKDSSVRYRHPTDVSPNLENRAIACTTIPSFGGAAGTDGIIQLVVASRPEEPCAGLTHYTLIGCEDGELECDAPEWDLRENPPVWWPCPGGN
jgi:hypothetical protein